MSRRRVVGAVGAVGAFLAIGVVPLAPAANADWDDWLQPIADLFSGADTAGSALALTPSDASFDDFYQDYIVAPFQSLEHDLGWLNGTSTADISGSAAAGGSTNLGPDQIPLTVNPSYVSADGATKLGGEPVINVNVGGGHDTNVLVDTGSNGLVIPWQDYGWQGAGMPTNFGVGSFAGGVGYVYMTVPTTVEFGHNVDLTATDTDVNVVLFSFPTTLQQMFAGHWTIGSMLGPADATGILGIGPNASGPMDHNPIQDLPGDLGKGVLIDQANGTMTFGADPLTGGVTIAGAPITPLWVSFDGGQTAHQVTGIMDSGGVFGTIPQNLTEGKVGDILASGQQVTVYNGDPTKGGTELYDYTVNSTGTNSPVIGQMGSYMNTGNWLFQQNQVYVSMAGNGSMHIVPNETVTP
ncbi:PecA family PE domain-processing aspartic protease [Mycobacterium sp. M1]|uniref:PecA family PE domain-processing aspartic protease n=1 Tax=Mycolicibacter acidiphilus TaxID=2835306 RepID=A0ABS5RE10_9MYCO|nr:PecA family PE domain-processing aspartic protease [Mycolicibacter acidiphilus]MBS9532528.1 PecA family PE domain-processing aspartic protease [Mycolicibacter acidiphilus]